MLADDLISTCVVCDNNDKDQKNRYKEISAILTAEKKNNEVNIRSLSFTEAGRLNFTDKELKIMLMDKLITACIIKSGIDFIKVIIGIPDGINCFAQETFFTDYDILRKFGFKEFNVDRKISDSCLMILSLDSVRKGIEYL